MQVSVLENIILTYLFCPVENIKTDWQIQMWYMAKEIAYICLLLYKSTIVQVCSVCGFFFLFVVFPLQIFFQT